jgi:hypothetical protein
MSESYGEAEVNGSRSAMSEVETFAHQLAAASPRYG